MNICPTALEEAAYITEHYRIIAVFRGYEMRESETSMAGHHVVLNRVLVMLMTKTLCSTEVNAVLFHSYIILKSSYLLEF